MLKQNVTIKNNRKKALRKVKPIENTVSQGDPCTKFFSAQDCVLDADMMLLISYPECLGNRVIAFGKIKINYLKL